MTSDHSTMTTMPTEWARVDAALDELLSLDPKEWPAAILRVAQGDTALADELQSLLAAAFENEAMHRGTNRRDDDDRAARAARLDGLDRETLDMAANLRRAISGDAPGGEARASDDAPHLPTIPVSRRRGARPARGVPPGLGMALSVVAGVAAAWAWHHFRG
jgi:hypothetical protein